ncbi:hypothetical protein [Candidatus Poriferisodalis sp.]|uniref:hypothetical protein n=1 Tax=Candidatus Poriferisodalis sp. TaxID=3101277 RepID=UPI003B58D6D3
MTVTVEETRKRLATTPDEVRQAAASYRQLGGMLPGWRAFWRTHALAFSEAAGDEMSGLAALFAGPVPAR